MSISNNNNDDYGDNNNNNSIIKRSARWKNFGGDARMRIHRANFDNVIVDHRTDRARRGGIKTFSLRTCAFSYTMSYRIRSIEKLSSLLCMHTETLTHWNSCCNQWNNAKFIEPHDTHSKGNPPRCVAHVIDIAWNRKIKKRALTVQGAARTKGGEEGASNENRKVEISRKFKHKGFVVQNVAAMQKNVPADESLNDDIVGVCMCSRANVRYVDKKSIADDVNIYRRGPFALGSTKKG